MGSLGRPVDASSASCLVVTGTIRAQDFAFQNTNVSNDWSQIRYKEGVCHFLSYWRRRPSRSPPWPSADERFPLAAHEFRAVV
jgi:hypothetical protein